jgi:uncharacterized membrane protein
VARVFWMSRLPVCKYERVVVVVVWSTLYNVPQGLKWLCFCSVSDDDPCGWLIGNQSSTCP